MEPPKRLRGQIIRSGVHGDYTVTREAVEGMLEQIQAAPKPVNIEHDPTVRPVGRIKNARLIELGDGEVALETEMELFDGEVSVLLKPVGELRREIAQLPPISAEDGPLEITTDPRSYTTPDVQALREIAARAGGAEAFDNAMRFSVTPDALLMIGLGTSGLAAMWFLKGFFTKAGEGLGEEVGKDLAGAYRDFKDQAVEMVERRDPADRPPITMFTFQLPRPDGELVEIEGSTRGVRDQLAAFLDAGSELLPIAQAYLASAPEPDRVAKMHFAHTGAGWAYVYGLDDEALPVMIVPISDEDYAGALARVEAEAGPDSEGRGRPGAG
jgi:hypothetical protein